MNERIRELWAQCVVNHTKDPMNWQTVADEFALLIVGECVDIVSKVPNGYRDYRNQIEDAMRGDCLQAIQEHFGVE